MATTTHPNRPTQVSMTGTSRSLWRFMTTPHVELTGEAWRQARLLLYLLAVLLPMAVGVLVFEIIHQFAGSTSPNLSGVILGFSAVALVSVAYVFAKTQQFRYGAFLFAAMPTLAILITIVLFPPESPESFLWYYLVISTVLGSLLLTPGQTILIAILNAAILIGLGLFVPGWGLNELLGELFFHLFIPVLLVVSAVIRQQNVAQIQQLVGDLEVRFQEAEAARAQAERSDKVKSAFLASMSHELRTPLNAVINFTKFVANGDLGEVNEMQQETLGEVISSAKHLLTLINDVLDMSKIESGTLNLFVEENVDVRAILDTTMTTAKSLTLDKPITLHSEVADDLPMIRADRQRVLQVLLNIISNACKFTEEGAITLHARRSGDDILISVTDTGPGIAREDQSLVFQAFKQTTTGLRQGGGTGLGMPISKSLVEAHNGRMWMESEQGLGTTFYVCLPVKSEQLKPIFTTTVQG